MTEEINLKAKKPESEHQKDIDRFALSATRRWFEWLGWVLILGAFTYLQKITGHISVSIILTISGVLFILHFMTFFYQWELKNLPFIKDKNIARTISYLLSASLGMGTYYLLTTVVQILSVNKP